MTVKKGGFISIYKNFMKAMKFSYLKTKEGIHIRKSENDTDLIERFEQDGFNFKSSLKLCLPYAVRELDYCNAENLKGKYRELINKNLVNRIIRKDLLPYVKGVFKVKSRY